MYNLHLAWHSRSSDCSWHCTNIVLSICLFVCFHSMLRLAVSKTLHSLDDDPDFIAADFPLFLQYFLSFILSVICFVSRVTACLACVSMQMQSTKASYVCCCFYFFSPRKKEVKLNYGYVYTFKLALDSWLQREEWSTFIYGLMYSCDICILLSEQNVHV